MGFALAFISVSNACLAQQQGGDRDILPQAQEGLVIQGQAHCPLCMAGGYGASSANQYRWLLNSVYAPTTETEDETFLWYSVNQRLSLGVGFLAKQGAFRAMGSYMLSPEKATMPSLNFSAGVQGIGSGNPGISLTSEKNFVTSHGAFNVFVGLGYRTNIKTLRPVGGLKYSPTQHWTIGYQNDGENEYPFVTYTSGRMSYGLFLIAFESPAILVGTRF